MSKLSLKQTLKDLDTKKISIRELNQDYLKRIKENENLNVFIHFSEENVLKQIDNLEKDNSAKKLKGMEDKIRTLTQNNQDESDILSPETLKAIDGFKSEMMSTRSQLRTVKFDLRRDVEALKKWIISINVAILPIFFASIALLISLRRRRKNSY